MFFVALSQQTERDPMLKKFLKQVFWRVLCSQTPSIAYKLWCGFINPILVDMIKHFKMWPFFNFVF